MNCPCHSDIPYDLCCAPYHKGEKLPQTPLELMCSRYSAYALGLVEYIQQTTHPDKPDQGTTESIRHFCNITEFKGLEILSAEEDQVTFRAYLLQEGEDVSFTEKSTFARHLGRWCYLSGNYLNIV